MFFDSKLVELHDKIKQFLNQEKKQVLAFLSHKLQMQSDFSLLLSETHQMARVGSKLANSCFRIVIWSVKLVTAISKNSTHWPYLINNCKI